MFLSFLLSFLSFPFFFLFSYFISSFFSLSRLLSHGFFSQFFILLFFWTLILLSSVPEILKQNNKEKLNNKNLDLAQSYTFRICGFGDWRGRLGLVSLGTGLRTGLVP